MNLLDLPGYLTSRKSFHLMSSQALTGIAFDKEAAEKLVVRIQHEMQEIEQDVEPTLPPCPLNKGETKEFTVPAKPFKKDGTLSATMEKFLSKHGLTAHKEGDNVPYIQWVDGSFHTIEAGYVLPATKPMRLGNQQDIKDYLLSQGWSPTLWSFKKGPNGKPLRDRQGKEIRTSPKLHEKGKLCENLALMEGTQVKAIIRWLSLRNRLSTLVNLDGERGWLNDPRLAFDGRLSTGSYGLTQTHRQKHAVVRNVPKAKDDVLLGKEFRGLFIASPGKVLVGWDASGLEDRLKAHYTFQFDGGEYARKVLSEGYDVHQEAADAWGIPRHTAKNGVYALAYNAGPRKLSETIKSTLQEAEMYHAKYWEINKALQQLDQTVGLWWETKGNKKWIKSIDGRLIPSRSRHSVVNTLIQSTGAILFDWSLIWLDWKLGGLDKNQEYHYNGYVAKRVGYFHDEAIMECDPEIAEDIARLGVASVKAAGKRFKLNVPLESEAAIGHSWKELK